MLYDLLVMGPCDPSIYPHLCGKGDAGLASFFLAALVLNVLYSTIWLLPAYGVYWYYVRHVPRKSWAALRAKLQDQGISDVPLDLALAGQYQSPILELILIPMADAYVKGSPCEMDKVENEYCGIASHCKSLGLDVPDHPLKAYALGPRTQKELLRALFKATFHQMGKVIPF